MPELPEVETVAAGLKQAIEGDYFTNIELMREGLRYPFDVDFAEKLQDNKIQSIRRRAKYLIFRFEDETVLIGHLGMSGSFRIDNEAPEKLDKHDHVTFETNNGKFIRYHDPRRFGFLLLTTEDELETHPSLKNVGPEPLGNHFNLPYFLDVLAKRKSPIKTTILDQKVVAGVGNIYACEALYRAKISPEKLACDLTEKEAGLLLSAIRDVLADAIKSGGSTLRDYTKTDGELGYFQHKFQVYGHEGEACPNEACSSVIERITQSGRSTFFCPSCQT